MTPILPLNVRIRLKSESRLMRFLGTILGAWLCALGPGHVAAFGGAVTTAECDCSSKGNELMPAESARNGHPGGFEPCLIGTCLRAKFAALLYFRSPQRLDLAAFRACECAHGIAELELARTDLGAELSTATVGLVRGGRADKLSPAKQANDIDRTGSGPARPYLYHIVVAYESGPAPGCVAAAACGHEVIRGVVLGVVVNMVDNKRPARCAGSTGLPFNGIATPMAWMLAAANLAVEQKAVFRDGAIHIGEWVAVRRDHLTPKPFLRTHYLGSPVASKRTELSSLTTRSELGRTTDAYEECHAAILPIFGVAVKRFGRRWGDRRHGNR